MSRAWRLAGRILFWACWPALFIYLRLGARTRVYVVADDQLLLVRGWLSGGTWMLPGGGLHRGENPTAGAVREVAEETGVVLDPAVLLPVGNGYRSSYGIRSYLQFFVTVLPQPAELRRQRGEILDARWFPLGGLPNPRLETEVRQALALLAGSK